MSSNKFLIENIRTSQEFGLSSKKKMQNIMSKLNLLLDEYLAIESLKNDQHELNLRLFQSYNDRSLYSLANNKAESLIKNWAHQPSIDIHLFIFLLRLQHYQYFSENPITYQTDERLLHNLMSTFSQFNEVFFQFYQFINDHSISINSKDFFDEKRISELEITSRNLEIINSIKILHTENNIDSFEFLYSQLLSGIHISSEMKTIIFEFCERFLRNEIRKSNSSYYLNKILDFYDFGMEEKLLLYKGVISTIKFQNIIQTACLAQNFNWAQNFLDKYKEFVPAEHIDGSQSLALVQINCGRARYNEAIELVLFTEFKTFGLKLLSRFYLLVCYFVTHDSLDFMDSQIINFTQFIYYNKKRISAINFESSLNLIKVIRLKMNHSHKFDLEEELKRYENILFKNRLHTFFEHRRDYIEKHNVKL